MGLKTFTISQEVLATSKHCRLDQKYASFTHIDNWVVFPSKYKQIRLFEFIEPLPIIKFSKGVLEDDFFLVNISDQEQRSGELENIEIVNEIGSDKNFLGNSDIFISKLGMPKGYIFLNNYKGQNILGSTEFIPYKIKNADIQLLVKYLLLHPRSLSAYSFLESGKTPSHRRVNPYEFLNIKIPLIPKDICKKIISQTFPIETKIRDLKLHIKQSQEIIDTVFIRELKFDINKFNRIKEDKFFEISISDITTSLIRSTIIQNNSSSNFLRKFLSKNTIYLKNILVKPIKRGKQPIYTDEGVKVIKTLNIQNGKLNFNEVQFVSEKYLKDNEEKAGVYLNDLILSSTGMGRGKFALYEDEEICLADSHISIIRFNHEYFIPNFLNYYCQSLMGIEQLKYIEMHIKGTPEIYEAQLNYFQIPNFSIKKQLDIVAEIKTELDKQETIKYKILEERNKIDKIIEDYIILS